MTKFVPQDYSIKIKLVVSDSMLCVFVSIYYKQLVRRVLLYFELFYDYFHLPCWNSVSRSMRSNPVAVDSNNLSIERKSKLRGKL